ncbi:MAG: flavodoxin [Oscillospiraceae bacterium]|nr:flavodoxin [Oscillospiraceae bacterium]
MGKSLDDKVFSLTSLINTPDGDKLVSETPYIFVVPTYCYHIPSVVEDFIMRASFGGNNGIYFVMTCGAGVGGAGAANRALCKKKKLRYMGTYTLVAPDNYLVMYEPSDREESERRLSVFPEKISGIADTVRSGAAFSEKSSLLGRQISTAGSRLFNKFLVNPGKFTVNNACVSCGLCAGNCPLHNIDIVDRAPKWGNDCIHCLSCICVCPKSAIEYGKSTKGRRRHYVFPDGTLK